MKLFDCPFCGNIVYFESRACAACGRGLGYLPSRECMASAEDLIAGTHSVCANAAFDVCNWLVEDGPAYCLACRHNGTVPNLEMPQHQARWKDLEIAKHRLMYSLLRWRLPLKTRSEDAAHGLVFNFLADDSQGENKVMTGHASGIITLALAEADDIERERRRLEMNEPYRTLLGHFGHEIGHYYWDILVRDGGKLTACREVFGDDTIDYAVALRKHYESATPADWEDRYVSAYAASHPWEDFAESWAHYLHIVDRLEMASQFGLKIKPSLDRVGGLSARTDFDPYTSEDFAKISGAWFPVVFALNSVNRAMGAKDLYPFILSPAVLEKLNFVHRLVRGKGLR